VEFLVRGRFLFDLTVFEYSVEVSVELFAVRGSLSTTFAAMPLFIRHLYRIPCNTQQWIKYPLYI
jgi:hypothetical protein